jgi:hypothetical protein
MWPGLPGEVSENGERATVVCGIRLAAGHNSEPAGTTAGPYEVHNGNPERNFLVGGSSLLSRDAAQGRAFASSNDVKKARKGAEKLSFDDYVFPAYTNSVAFRHRRNTDPSRFRSETLASTNWLSMSERRPIFLVKSPSKSWPDDCQYERKARQLIRLPPCHPQVTSGTN